MTDLIPIPVRPARHTNNGFALERAAFASFVGHHRGKRPVNIALDLWPQDKLTPQVFGAKSAQTVGSTDGWGGSLVADATADFFGSLGPLSAIGQIIGRGLIVSLDQNGEIKIPYRPAAPNQAPWVGEGDPIRVVSYGFDKATLGPARKAAVITVCSGELVRRTGAEAIFRRLLREDAGRTLDGAYFSSDPATDDGVAGLLYGVTGTPGGGTVREDMAALAGAVSSSGEVVFVASAKRAARMRILEPELASLVLASPAVADSRLIALDPLALVHGFGGEPEIATSIEALVHMSDAPSPISAGGVADPVRSLFQTDGVATRMIIDLSFTKMNASAVGFMDAPSW